MELVTPNTSYLVLVLPLGKGHEVHSYQLCSTHFLANYGNVSHCALLLEHREGLNMSTDLTSWEIKPEGHYVLIKHNYS